VPAGSATDGAATDGPVPGGSGGPESAGGSGRPEWSGGSAAGGGPGHLVRLVGTDGLDGSAFRLGSSVGTGGDGAGGSSGPGRSGGSWPGVARAGRLTWLSAAGGLASPAPGTSCGLALAA